MPNQLKPGQWFETTELAELGPGPRAGVQSEADLEEQLKPALESSALPKENQELIRALVLLWHDHLDSAHQIAQEINTASGAFVHGMMHRREPDFGNSAYWFRRVGNHGAYPTIASRVRLLFEQASDQDLAAILIPKGAWDPFAFIAACERASGRGQEHNREVLRRIQKIEFLALLDSLSSVS